MAGGTVHLVGQRRFDLPLTARNTTPPPLYQEQFDRTRFLCSWCGVGFGYEYALDRHFRRDHGDLWDRARQRVVDFIDDFF